MTARTTARRTRWLTLLGGLTLAVPVALGFNGPAQASFPGTNGKIICSGPIATEIPSPPPAGQSRVELFSINPDATGQTRLTNNTVSDLGPRYSADGTKVAWVRDNQIWTMNADGSNQQGPLTSGASNSFMGDWSPDGTKLLFQSNRDGNLEVYVMNADGSDPVNLTNNATAGANTDSQPAYSPDGTRIAFQSNRDGNRNVHVMNADGSNVVNLTAGSPGDDSAPRWSPGGTKIAFHSDRAVFPRPGWPRNTEIYRMNADGSDVVRLTTNDYDPVGGSDPTNVTGVDSNPAWSPDGTRIVFDSGRAAEFRDRFDGGYGQSEVYHVDAVAGEGAGGAGLVRLTTSGGDEERCDWQPIPRQTLTVTKAGAGSGTVVSAPSGIDCGADCSEAYGRDTQVTLAANPASGSRFDGFSGAGCSGTSTCTVTMSEARAVAATFSIAPTTTTTTTTQDATPRKAPKLSVDVRPQRDRRRPFRFTVRGRITRPAGVTAADGCKGRVTVRFKAGRKTISSRRAQLTSTCRYSRSVTFQSRKRFPRLRYLRVQATFEGNEVLLPKKSGIVRARVR